MATLKKLPLKSPLLVRFFMPAIIFYLSWLLLYEFFIRPHTLIDEKVISNLIFISSAILSLLNYPIYASTQDINEQLIGVEGSNPIWIGDPCNAVTLIALFSIFIIAFPGKLKNKAWYIPAGILAIHAVNIFRVCSLTLIQYYFPKYLDFNHNYTFTLLVYSFIFLLWIIWVNRYSCLTFGKANTHEKS